MPPLRALWSRLDTIWDVLAGSWGVLAEDRIQDQDTPEYEISGHLSGSKYFGSWVFLPSSDGKPAVVNRSPACCLGLSAIHKRMNIHIFNI